MFNLISSKLIRMSCKRQQANTALTAGFRRGNGCSSSRRHSTRAFAPQLAHASLMENLCSPSKPLYLHRPLDPRSGMYDSGICVRHAWTPAPQLLLHISTDV
jgi:hypothetical protein